MCSESARRTTWQNVRISVRKEKNKSKDILFDLYIVGMNSALGVEQHLCLIVKEHGLLKQGLTTGRRTLSPLSFR